MDGLTETGEQNDQRKSIIANYFYYLLDHEMDNSILHCESYACSSSSKKALNEIRNPLVAI